MTYQGAVRAPSRLFQEQRAGKFYVEYSAIAEKLTRAIPFKGPIFVAVRLRHSFSKVFCYDFIGH
jgi:hypothetical protein